MYILEGNIGAGKSTLLNLLGTEIPNISVLQEPAHKWYNTDNGLSLLNLFYQQPDRWAFTIETLAMISRVKDHTNEQKKKNQIIVMERSIYSGYYCFAKNGHVNGFMTDIEWSIHNQWFDFLITNKCQIPDGFIYIQTDPEIAFERIKKRNRDAEQSISQKYINQIHDFHEQFLIEKKEVSAQLKSVPVLILDGNHEFETDSAQLKKYISSINQFLRETYNLPAAPGKNKELQ